MAFVLRSWEGGIIVQPISSRIYELVFWVR